MCLLPFDKPWQQALHWMCCCERNFYRDLPYPLFAVEVFNKIVSKFHMIFDVMKDNRIYFKTGYSVVQ